ncbi:glyoxalase/bleomycin resistance/extradiol dioxygenase family protein [Saccharibacillus sp. O23]|uniref:glyoxalase superfamily protein n=1 Tax=Saccharibacillus sp. O23 TaxID=2009338 RepID=UPI000B4E2B43|nr:glyoxalase superfamily protein [Saccharibacillus sp. O23]OWR29870.1 glyoxalase/bleomycin resistance/extradiol dioxygenase family protein [Saccharibacillus sp. O23]
MTADETELTELIPILRIFDENKARAFYVDYLGFTVDFEHRFEEGMPLYFQVSRGPIKLHLSEHNGDCKPGSAVRIGARNLEALRSELQDKPHDFSLPDIVSKSWGMRELGLFDPFGNRVVFWE